MKEEEYQTMQSDYSIYIPRISAKYYNEQQIIVMFNEAGIGFVKRVDFIEVSPCLSTNNAAFVHFHYLYDNETARNIASILETENESFRWQITEKEYWILLKNRKPICETKLNIHQVVDIIKVMEEEHLKKSEEQDKVIEEQGKQMETMEARLQYLESLLLQRI